MCMSLDGVFGICMGSLERLEAAAGEASCDRGWLARLADGTGIDNRSEGSGGGYGEIDIDVTEAE